MNQALNESAAKSFLSPNVFRIAIPCQNLDASEDFYVKKLGYSLKQKHPDRIMIDFSGALIVSYLFPEKNDNLPQIYPRHFGLVLPDTDSYNTILARAAEKQLDFIQESQLKRKGQAGKQLNFYIKDPANNIIQFSYWIGKKAIIVNEAMNGNFEESIFSTTISHVAIPCKNIDDTENFYVNRLGCSLAKKYSDRIVINFWGSLIVCHLYPEKADKVAEIYPRHFGIVLSNQTAYNYILKNAKENHLDFLQESQIDRSEESLSFYLKDPANNAVKFQVSLN